MGCEWVSNIYKQDKPNYMQWAGFSIGEPHATKFLSVQEIKDRGLIGLYRDFDIPQTNVGQLLMTVDDNQVVLRRQNDNKTASN